ncbi:ABC transporter permease [Candidatus Bipolaricaulota sp. J31]
MKLLKVARWEFSQRVRSKAFLVTLFVTPFIWGVAGSIPMLVGRAVEGEERVVAVIDATENILPELSRLLEGSRIRIIGAEAPLEELIGSLGRKEIDGVLVLEEDLLHGSAATLYSRGFGGAWVGELREALGRAVSAWRLQNKGYDPSEIFSLIEDVKVVPVPVGQKLPDPRAVALPLGIAILLNVGAFMAGMTLFSNIVNEKRERQAEILLSSITARDFLLGKVIGIGGAIFLQVAIWGALGYVVAQRAFDFPISITQLPLPKLLLSLLYFALGYLFFCALLSVFGAGVEAREGEGGAVGLVVMLPMVPLWLSGLVIMEPDLQIWRLLNLIPFFTPGMMVLRLGMGEVTWWEIAATLAVLSLATVLLVEFAAKVLQVGLLMYGKSASLRELWRWGIRAFRTNVGDKARRYRSRKNAASEKDVASHFTCDDLSFLREHELVCSSSSDSSSWP